MDINSVVEDAATPACPAFFDQAVSNGATPDESLASGMGESDDVNLTLGSSGGYAALAPAVSACGFYPPSNPLPATS